MAIFLNDYNSVGHPDIIGAIAKSSGDMYAGYGDDRMCECAADTIRGFVGKPDAQVHFLAGGTQANLIATAAFLRPHEAVIAASSGHMNVHEAGAIEATGHKILAAEPSDGKITPEQISHICAVHSNEHLVKPRLVYISQATEYGTLYSLSELKALRLVCDRLGLLLYLDGARLGVSLTASTNDASIEDIASLVDVFYLGGTKNGLMFGEALVIINPTIWDDIRYIIKQRGGLFAKGFLIGLQFDYALKSGLYLEIPQKANEQAEKLRDGLSQRGCLFAVDSPTNQIFPVLNNDAVEELSKDYQFEIWEKFDEARTTIRLVTTWQTTDAEIDMLLGKLDAVL